MTGKTCAGTLVTGLGKDGSPRQDLPLPRRRQRVVDARVRLAGGRLADGAQPGRRARAARRAATGAAPACSAPRRSRRSRSSTSSPSYGSPHGVARAQRPLSGLPYSRVRAVPTISPRRSSTSMKRSETEIVRCRHGRREASRAPLPSSAGAGELELDGATVLRRAARARAAHPAVAGWVLDERGGSGSTSTSSSTARSRPEETAGRRDDRMHVLPAITGG